LSSCGCAPSRSCNCCAGRGGSRSRCNTALGQGHHMRRYWREFEPSIREFAIRSAVPREAPLLFCLACTRVCVLDKYNLDLALATHFQLGLKHASHRRLHFNHYTALLPFHLASRYDCTKRHCRAWGAAYFHLDLGLRVIGNQLTFVVHKRRLHIDTAVGHFQNRLLDQETVLLCQCKHHETNVHAVDITVQVGIHLPFLILLVAVLHLESGNVALHEVQVR